MTYAIMSDADYKGICDTVREKTETSALLKSAEVAPAIRSIELGGTSLMLTITTEAGATVTATKGSLSVTAVATNGTATLKLKEAGEWTVTATLNGETSLPVLVSVSDSYELSLSYFAVDPIFANNSWEKIIEACKRRLVPESWVVGNQKTMTINGRDYAIDIIGKNHDDYADGSGKAPLTLQMHDCYAESVYNMYSSSTNVGGWTECLMRKTHLPAIFSLFPAEVQAGIKEVAKLTSAGNKGTNIVTTADTLFLLSEIEALGTTSRSVSGEGIQYAYYAAGNSPIKYMSGSAKVWWLRSPRASYDSQFCQVSTSGAIGSAASQNTRGVAPAFCF